MQCSRVDRCNAMQWSAMESIDGMQCSGVEWNGVDGCSGWTIRMDDPDPTCSRTIWFWVFRPSRQFPFFESGSFFFFLRGAFENGLKKKACHKISIFEKCFCAFLLMFLSDFGTFDFSGTNTNAQHTFPRAPKQVPRARTTLSIFFLF